MCVLKCNIQNEFELKERESQLVEATWACVLKQKSLYCARKCSGQKRRWAAPEGRRLRTNISSRKSSVEKHIRITNTSDTATGLHRREDCSLASTVHTVGRRWKAEQLLVLCLFPWVTAWGSSPLATGQRAALLTGSSLLCFLSSAARGTTVMTQEWCWPRGSSLWLWEGDQRRCWFGSSDDLGGKEERRSFWCGGSWCPSPGSQSASSLHSPAHWSRYLENRQRVSQQRGSHHYTFKHGREFISSCLRSSSPRVFSGSVRAVPLPPSVETETPDSWREGRNHIIPTKKTW